MHAEEELEKSAIAKHAWKHHYPILWDEISMIDRASEWRALLVKETLHIQLAPTLVSALQWRCRPGATVSRLSRLHT